MKKYLVLNDLHLGVQRATGTTPASAAALREWLHDTHGALIHDAKFAQHDLIYNGDIFDTFQVPLADTLRLVQIWTLWLQTYAGNIYAGRGNHDISKDSSRCSMFDFTCEVMQSAFPTRFIPITEFTAISPRIYVLPHCTNQAEFDRELTKAEGLISNAILLLHANYDNPFSENSDHSLSVSVVQAEAFRKKGNKLLFGHEHDHKLAADGLVWVTGNQFPTSVADLKASSVKYYAEIVVTSDAPPEILMVQIDDYGDTNFEDVDWRSLTSMQSFPRFLRVSGSVSAEENFKVIDIIANLRESAPETFVITNAVHVQELDDVAAMQATSEEIKAVNVFEFLYEQLEPEQVTTIKGLLNAETA